MALIGDLRRAAARERERRRLTAAAPGVRVGTGVEVRAPERLRLAEHVVIDSGVLLHCGGQEWSGGGGGISIGPHSYIGPNCVLFGAGGIDIGEGALISPGVAITSHQHTFASTELDIREQPLHFAAVTIERNVWIGANATVLPGVRIGAGSIVGAGAVVSRDVPPGVVVMGVPARIARER
jgi:acetyltransferase-like isoleucine patch superfamily enzyme